VGPPAPVTAAVISSLPGAVAGKHKRQQLAYPQQMMPVAKQRSGASWQLPSLLDSL
jgi:hypothetical protein